MPIPRKPVRRTLSRTEEREQIELYIAQHGVKRVRAPDDWQFLRELTSISDQLSWLERHDPASRGGGRT